jgi:hypothetical protein
MRWQGGRKGSCQGAASAVEQGTAGRAGLVGACYARFMLKNHLCLDSECLFPLVPKKQCCLLVLSLSGCAPVGVGEVGEGVGGQPPTCLGRCWVPLQDRTPPPRRKRCA